MSETPQEVCRSLLWLLSLSCLMLHSTSYSSDVACCMVFWWFRKVESQNLQLSLWVNPTNLDWLPHQWGNRCPQFLYHLISFSKPNCKGCFHEYFKSWCLPQADHCTSGLCHDGVDCAWGNWNEWSDCVPAKLSVLRHVRLFMSRRILSELLAGFGISQLWMKQRAFKAPTECGIGYKRPALGYKMI